MLGNDVPAGRATQTGRMGQPPRSAVVATACAMIIVPPVAALVRLLGMGWLLFFFGIFVLLIGVPLYAFAIVIASASMLAKDGSISRSRSGWRALVAAWAALVALLASALSSVDAGDDGVSGVLFRLLAFESVDGAVDAFMAVSMILLAVWAACSLWFVIEWSLSLAARRAQRLAGVVAAPYAPPHGPAVPAPYAPPHAGVVPEPYAPPMPPYGAGWPTGPDRGGAFAPRDR